MHSGADTHRPPEDPPSFLHSPKVDSARPLFPLLSRGVPFRGAHSRSIDISLFQDNQFHGSPGWVPDAAPARGNLPSNQEEA
jgi:hypothetical protein